MHMFQNKVAEVQVLWALNCCLIVYVIDVQNLVTDMFQNNILSWHSSSNIFVRTFMLALGKSSTAKEML